MGYTRIYPETWEVSDEVSPHFGDILDLREDLRNFVIVSIIVLNLIARSRYETGVERVL